MLEFLGGGECCAKSLLSHGPTCDEQSKPFGAAREGGCGEVVSGFFSDARNIFKRSRDTKYDQHTICGRSICG